MEKSKSFSINKIGCFVYFYLAIFGPKIGTYLDISFFTNVFILFLCSKHKIEIYKEFINLIIGVLSLLLYSFLIIVLSGETDVLFLFKFIRAFISILAISSFVKTSELDENELLSCVTDVLLLHAIIVLIGALIWVDLQAMLRPITGYTKTIYAFRSTGLTNGYDFSGMLCCFGILITFFGDKRRFNNVRLIVFIIAAIFTSRFTMILAEAIIVYLIISNRKKARISKTLLTIVFVVSILPILGIVLFSTNNFDNPVVSYLMNYESFRRISSRLVYYYAAGTINDSFVDNYNFTSLRPFEIIFGCMREAHQDPGITQYIFKVGVVGLAIALFSYLSIIITTIKHRKDNRDLVVVITIASFLCIIMSSKNSYLFARHVTEFIMILFSLLIIRQNDYDEKRFL